MMKQGMTIMIMDIITLAHDHDDKGAHFDKARRVDNTFAEGQNGEYSWNHGFMTVVLWGCRTVTVRTNMVCQGIVMNIMIAIHMGINCIPRKPRPCTTTKST